MYHLLISFTKSDTILANYVYLKETNYEWFYKKKNNIIEISEKKTVFNLENMKKKKGNDWQKMDKKGSKYYS